MHPGRSARQHLRAFAALTGVASCRVDDVLALVGLESVADQRAGGYSLGMRQRLALAGALLADPEVLMLDEPSNGLDPDGIRWLRDLLRGHSNRGGTVFVSSHLISELAMFADDLVVVGMGTLIVADTVHAIQQRSGRHILVRADRLADLHQLLSTDGVDVEHSDGRLIVHNGSVGDISQRALDHGIVLTELTEKTQSLEDSLLGLTRSSTEFTAS
jgi:ABC-2 type transport system ATP-binding protein